ncbi:MAG: hypothetical protein WAN11_24325 [Syntrophobacteraceae bacterium]
MIVRTKDSYTYFLILDEVCTEQQWLSATGVRPKSPAANIAARVYSCFFRGITDVIAEYEKYYKREYSDLWVFLYWHYTIDEDTLEEIRKVYKPSQRLLYGSVQAGGDYQIGEYAMSEEGFPVIKRILSKICMEREL